jgi:hypothetical protein
MVNIKSQRRKGRDFYLRRGIQHGFVQIKAEGKGVLDNVAGIFFSDKRPGNKTA